jgi:hypothetical protein
MQIIFRGDTSEWWQSVNRPLGKLDAAFQRHLSDASSGSRTGLLPVDFERQETSGGVIYRLSHSGLGQLGIIELRDISDKVTGVGITQQPVPRKLQPTSREKAQVEAAAPEDQAELVNQAIARIAEDEEQLRRKCLDYFDRIVGQLLHQQLRFDPVLGNVIAALLPEDGLDEIDQQIIKLVPKLRDSGHRVTDELLAMRLPLNPNTGMPYHRTTVNKRRNNLRTKGYEV